MSISSQPRGYAQPRQPGQQVQGDASYGRVDSSVGQEENGRAPWYQKVNDSINSFYYRLGMKIGARPLTFFLLTLVAGCLCILGFTKLYSEGDIYKLWIESNSRLVKERQFDQDHFSAVTARAAYVYGNVRPSAGPTILTSSSLAEWYDAHQQISAVNITYKGKVYTREDICDRTTHPPSLTPFFRASGLQGFPCFRLTVLDCFSEGAYDALPENLALFVPTEQLTLPDAFRRIKVNGVFQPHKKPSFKNKTLDELRNITHGSCTQWADSLIPENFLMGGVVRNPALGSMPVFPRLGLNAIEPRIDTIASFQSALSVKTFDQMGAVVASRRCNEGCNQGCDLKNQACLGSCAGTFQKNLPNCTRDYCAESAIVTCITNKITATCATPCMVTYGTTMQVNCTYFNSTANATQIDQGCAAKADSVKGTCIAGCSAEAVVTSAKNGCIDVCKNTCYVPAVYCSLACVGAIPSAAISLGQCAAMCNANCTRPTQQDLDDGKEIILAWEKAFLNRLGEIENKYSTLTLHYFSDRSSGDLVDEATAADASLVVLGYVFMIIYAILCTVRCSTLWSKTWVGTVGVLLVCLSTAGSMGLSAAFGIDFSPQIIQVLPALILGLGVNDMFVMVYTFRYDPSKSVEVMAADMLHEMGASTALASFTNCIAFAIGASIPLPSVSTFSLAALIGIAFNYFVLLFAFTAILVLDAKRIARGNMDWLCCVRSNTNNTEIEPRDDGKGLNAKFATIATQTPYQVAAVLISIALLIVAGIGINKIEVGLPLKDIVPHSSYASSFLETREAYYAETPVYIYTGMASNGNFVQLEYGKLQKQILDMERAIDKVPNTNPILTMAGQTVWDSYILWVNAAVWQNKFPTGYTAANFTAVLDPTTTYQLTATYKVNLLLPSRFYDLLPAFLNADGITLAEQIELSASGRSILAMKLPFFFHKSFTTQQIMDAIVNTRHVTDSQEFPCFPGGFSYNLYEQYMNVNKYLATDLGFCTLGVFFACLCLLFSPIATFIMTAVISIIILEVYGLLYYMDLKMNGVCVVNLVMAVGVAVEFTCYIIRAFMIESGTKRERTRAALISMALPTFNGGISTFLGVVTMAFAKFPYFRLYFFNMYVLIVFIGLFNGLALLPTILCFFGPKTLSGMQSSHPQAKYQTTQVVGANTEMVGTKKGSWVGGEEDQRKISQ